MKRCLALLAVLIVCSVFAIPQPRAVAQTPARKIRIGVSIPAADHGWTAGIGYWAKTEMAKYPDIDWVYATANEPNKQTGDIEDMMAKGVQGLVILATESAPI